MWDLCRLFVAAKTSSADAFALEEATAACKAEAKENKIRWPASRKYVSNCVAKTVKPTPEELHETGDRCMQGRGEGQEDQVAREPQIRQQLSLKRSQGLPS
jgi:hypothetical protein